MAKDPSGPSEPKTYTAAQKRAAVRQSLEGVDHDFAELSELTRLIEHHQQLRRIAYAFKLPYSENKLFFSMLVTTAVTICKIEKSDLAEALRTTEAMVRRYMQGATPNPAMRVPGKGTFDWCQILVMEYLCPLLQRRIEELEPRAVELKRLLLARYAEQDPGFADRIVQLFPKTDE